MKAKVGLAIITQSNKDFYRDMGNYTCQLAATIVEKYGGYPSAVFEMDIEKPIKVETFIDYVKDQLGVERPVFGFSVCGGIQFSSLLGLSRLLNERGYFSFIAGPGSKDYYFPEVGWRNYENKFQGNHDKFDFLLYGPAEQAIPVLRDIRSGGDYTSHNGVGLVLNGEKVLNPQSKVDLDFLAEVNWSNVYSITSKGVRPRRVGMGVVLAQWGCPYASKRNIIEINPPNGLESIGKTAIDVQGCTFCGYAAEIPKAHTLPLEHILAQVSAVPMIEGKSSFFLIHQYPLSVLGKIIEKSSVSIGEIAITLRPDHLVRNSAVVEETIQEAYRKGIEIKVYCVGFESFLPKILTFLNKGVTVEQNFEAISLLFKLAEKYPKNFNVKSGAHGWIFPTPWHSEEDMRSELKVVKSNGWVKNLFDDNVIDRELVISHTDYLADWIRSIEDKIGIRFQRNELGLIEWYTEAAQKWPSFLYGRKNTTLLDGKKGRFIGASSELIFLDDL